MHPTATHRRASILLFALVVAGAWASAAAIVGRMPLLHARASVVATALTLDLVVMVPAAFYLLVVRRCKLPVVALVPIVVFSALAASRLLPADRQQTLRVLEALALPLELGAISWIAWRASRAVRLARSDTSGDPLDRLRHAAYELSRNHRAAAVLATEIAVFWYALASWRARPHVPEGTTAFTHHERSGHAGIVAGFILVMAVEALAVHLLLLTWSTIAAWILTIGTVYGAVWLIADYRATVLRPIVVRDDDIVIRAGIRFTMRVPLAQIVAVGRTQPELGRDSVNLTFLGTPTHWLTLAEPMLADGPYGFHRRVRAIGVAPDAAEEFQRVVNRGPA
ncbi:MAG TPA: hypothetical protein VJ803_02090 [Gemmatimonadaceae bacterium]|nr:hypothetical protein [Gemmatimonadaceae bacterium]